MKTFCIIISLLLVIAPWATSVDSQNANVVQRPKGKPATSQTGKMATSRAVRRPANSLMSTAATFPEVTVLAAEPPEPQYVPNQVLVKFESREETRSRLNLTNLMVAKYRNEALRAEVQDTIDATLVNLVFTRSTDNPRVGDLVVYNLPADKTPDQAIDELQSQPGVKSVQKNWIYTLQQNPISNDAEYLNGTLWGMFGDDLPSAVGPSQTTNLFGVQAEKAWFNNHTGSQQVFVGIIDGGVQTDHPDLTRNVWNNPGEMGTDANGQDKSINGRDDDGNGVPDDVRGWDFAHHDASVYDAEIPDEHGTHVAGTIGAVGNNTIGVAGVNWTVTVIPAKVFGSAGASTDRIVEAINYFIRLKERGINVVAINNSWGGGPYDLSLFEAIKQAARVGILFVAAAGNYHRDNDAAPFYPASYDTTTDTRSEQGSEGVNYDSVISVAAITRSGDIAGFSNFGNNSVDLGAPGDTIMSTIPNDYGFMSGTSMASPHVAGGAALYASTHSSATARDIKNALFQTGIATPSLQARTLTGNRLTVAGF